MKAILRIFIILLLVSEGHACGPWFPERILDGPDDFARAAPEFTFAERIAWMFPQLPPAFPPVLPKGDQTERDQMATLEARDLAAALDAEGVRGAEKDRLLRETAAIRRTLDDNALTWSEDFSENEVMRVFKAQRRAAVAALIIPRGLPAEFDAYLHGARAYHAGKFDEARNHWETLLSLSPEHRCMRSTWAAFMIGKAWLAENEVQKARPWFAHVRKLARQGFKDGLGLAVCSFGWEAMSEWKCGHEECAAALYFEQARAGDPSGIASLRFLARQVIGRDGRSFDPALAMRAARDPLLQRVVTAYANELAPWRQGDAQSDSMATVRRWLTVVEEAKVAKVEGAENLAWTAYQIGDLELARCWLKRTTEETVFALWLKGKLALREGKVKEAADFLAKACRVFPEERREKRIGCQDETTSAWSRLRGEKGLMQLTHARFLEALDTLIEAGYWRDVAYLSERVLTIPELKDYVDRCCPEKPVQPKNSWVSFGESANPSSDLRWLLARRLVREGRFDEALPYLPPLLRPALREYAGSLRIGREMGRPTADRAAALYRAARIARHQGMELMGSELEPDWRVYGGDFKSAEVSMQRAAEQPAPGAMLTVSAGEKQRIAGNFIRPNRRFHYRYVAADMAWEAAAWMPDDSEETARVLCVAGSWIKDRDDKAADRFYQAIVRRCPRTSIGREAERIHWFPKVSEEAGGAM